MNQPDRTPRAASQLNEGWTQGGNFLGSILAGWLLGFLADTWLGTEPWLLITGILLGAYSGFMRLWHYSKKIEENPRGR